MDNLIELNEFDAQNMPKYGYEVIYKDGLALATEEDYLNYVDDITGEYLGMCGLI